MWFLSLFLQLQTSDIKQIFEIKIENNKVILKNVYVLQ